MHGIQTEHTGIKLERHVTACLRIYKKCAALLKYTFVHTEDIGNTPCCSHTDVFHCTNRVEQGTSVMCTQRGVGMMHTYGLPFEVVGADSLMFSTSRSGVHHYSTSDMYTVRELL